MDSLEDYFDSFIATVSQRGEEQRDELRHAFHAGAAAVCTILAQTDPEHYATVLKELQQEEHAFGKKEL